MGRIAILPPEVASKIAAGEVITRPASVVKELVENALDAGADRIFIEIVDGGRRLIRVIDNGSGMAPEEVPLSLERHATSKIRQDEDLLHLRTLGFRGEALASIAAVSQLELCSRSPEQPLGCRLTAAGGRVLAQEPWGGGPGTQVLVRDLFFNTPARRKFLRTPAAEQAHIVELVRQFALGYPEVTFQLRSGERLLLDAPGPVAQEVRMATLLPFEWIDRLLPVTAAYGEVRVSGLLSRPDDQAASPRYQYFLVNRRLVADRLLSSAVREAYQDLLPKGRHPVVLLQLTLPPEQVDVNVHPAKAEVRFRESGRVFTAVLTALRQALESGATSRPTPAAPTWQVVPAVRVAEARAPVFPPSTPSVAARSAHSNLAQLAVPEPAAAPLWETWRFQDLVILGQLHQTYIVAQAPVGLVLVDQHAAHERILYEQLRQQPGPLPAQALLLPSPVDLTPEQAAWVEEHQEDLRHYGLELEPFGGQTFVVRSLPACLATTETARVVQELLAELSHLKLPAGSSTCRQQLLLGLACRGAIKAGQRLTPEEMRDLLAALDTLPVASHCPHGRPLWRLLTLEEIRQNFRRPRH